ncbi:TetR/AcrR family transcriptional regulator [Archangium violaceum]|uniref:TetR/AcrR family transcriptional regulator n=1 Tax=Archangium violaceum TaxID=83451 RepID=UPI00195056CC|nr:TetR/AcrR family transcriptional regulator [Archangium violaceum]QRN96958.1 TetR/AcrR family transcriptional regulator [Archangium violaceum]
MKASKPRAGGAPTTELRERIRREATRLIAQRGFGAISVNDVAQAVGISKQALLYHYPSREALHEAIVSSIVERSNQHLLLLLGAFSGHGEERLTLAMGQLREFFDAEPDAARVILREVLDGDPTQVSRLHRSMEPWLRLVVDALRQGQREGRVRPELDPEAAVAHVGTLLLTSFALRKVGSWPEADDAEWRDRWLSEVVLIIQRYLFTEPGPERPKAGRPASRRQTK